MYLDYAKINSRQRKQPMLRLRTLAGKELGAIPYVYDLAFEINYSDVSMIEFSTPYMVDGMINPLYAALTSFKVIYTEDLGIYVLASPKKSGDGVQEIKSVTGYSIEQMFKKKTLFLEEGTYNFWNPVSSKDTILGRIIELDPTWSIGYVSPRLIECYRTFDEYDNDALSFCYGDAMEKYRCAFVFDVYSKRINVYDATEDAETLPIYLSYNNLLDSVEVEELTDDIATKVHLSGSDGLTIRDVNPMGTDYIVNLDFFIHNGDLNVNVGESETTLAQKVEEWQAAVAAKQTYYTGLASVRASLTAKKLTRQVELTTLKGELDTLTAKQSVIIQSMAMETTEAGKDKRQAELDTVNRQIASKNTEISSKESEIKGIDLEISGYMSALSEINKELSLEGYFSEPERKILSQYMIEASVNDETFVAIDTETSASGAVSSVSGSVSVTGSDITRVALSSFHKTMYAVSGGNLSIPGASLTASVMRGTLEIDGSGYVMTTYLGTTKYKGHNFPTGLITLSGILSGFSNNISAVVQNGITEYKGSQFSFQTTNADSYFTVSANDYQKYSAAMDLYTFGEEIIEDYAWPVYEFSVDSANFLYQKKFEPFKNSLELGKAVHLRLGSDGLINAKIIGFKLNFEDISKFELVFSNRYQKKNGRKFLKDLFNTASQSKRSINANKYTYNRAADKVTEVSEIMQQQLVAAVNNIVNKEDQTVLISSSGINIGGKSKYQMRMVDNMIALTDDGWKTAKLAIGMFATKDVGTQWGVNAEMLAGNILIGNKLVLQNPNDDGYMMVQVAETGAWLYNAQFILQDGNTGGLIAIDPRYGIAAGPKLLFDTNGTTVTPEFMDSVGDITYDSEGMPRNANFFLDIKDGNAYFRGKLIAKSGKIGGFSIADSYLYSGSNGTRVAINGGTDYYADYAFWAGAENPSSAPFWVKKNGEIKAKNGTFSGGKFENIAVSGQSTFNGGSFTSISVSGSSSFAGTLNAPKLSGKLTAVEGTGAELVGCAIYVPSKTNPNFKVDSSGNVTIKGGAISWGAVVGTDAIDNRINQAQNAADNAQDAADAAQSDANSANRAASAVDSALAALKKNIGYTYIDGQYVISPNIIGATIKGGKFYNVVGSAYLEIGGSEQGDLILWGSGRNPVFSVVDGVGGALIGVYNNDFLAVDDYKTSANGRWDFSNATVTGLDIDSTARFG